VWLVRLKDGREITVRFLTAEDKERLVEMFASMSDEALKWGMPPYTREVVERWINNIPSLIPLVAEDNNWIVGYATIFKYPHPRRKGVGDLAMYLHQDFHNAGLETAILDYLLGLARKEGVHRMGLHVIADNKIAIHLYEESGFKVEGAMKDSYFGADGKYHDEIVMGITWD
jgi:RimJ/RimL family protein N-acetyltransferase